MKAAVIREHGGYDKIVFETRSVPSPGPNQYLVRVKACGLNHLDTWVRRGVPGHKFPLPLVPGCDISGVIESRGAGAANFQIGDGVILNPEIFCGACENCVSGNDHLCRRWGLRGETGDGGCQEYVLADDRVLLPLPPTLSFEEAATIPIAYVTAWEMLVRKAQIRAGETVLIHAAGSGVSVASLQIAKMFGCQVIVTSTSDDKLKKALQIGADHIINSKKDEFRVAVRNITSKSGVDVVVDHVGAPTIMDSIRCLKKGGRLVSCGATAGAALSIDWKHVFFKNIALMGSTYGPVSVFQDTVRAFSQRKLHAVIDRVLTLDELPEAHRAIEAREVFGKVVIKIS